MTDYKVPAPKPNQIIGQPHLVLNVKYVFSPNGTVMIYISCSENSFCIHEEEDISIIIVLLGRLEERLACGMALVYMGYGCVNVVPCFFDCRIIQYHSGAPLKNVNGRLFQGSS